MRQVDNVQKRFIDVTYEAGETQSNESTPLALPFEAFILYVGQQSDYKNIKRLAQAHQEILKTRPNLGLVLAGKLNASALKNKSFFEAQEFKNIHFTDFVSDEQLNWLYQNARVYVFPSLMEGFGLPGLEAMAHNLPLVSSNATCLPEVYGSAAIYFDPLNVADMATKIESVLADTNIQKMLIVEGQKQLAKYSWQKMAQETHQIYIDTLDPKLKI